MVENFLPRGIGLGQSAQSVAVELRIEAILPLDLPLPGIEHARGNRRTGLTGFTGKHFIKPYRRHINANVKAIEQGPRQARNIFLPTDWQPMAGQLGVISMATA